MDKICGIYCIKNLKNNKVYIDKSWKNVEPVIQLDLNGNLIKEWRSTKDISNTLNISKTDISTCCKKIQKTAKKFKWMYKKDYKLCQGL